MMIHLLVSVLLAGAVSASKRMRVENLSYRPCRAGAQEVFRVVSSMGDDTVEEDPNRPGCYLMDVRTTPMNFRNVWSKVQAQPPGNLRAMLFKNMDVYTELDFDLSDDEIEACRRDPKNNPDALRTPDNVCGGFGSCLYCGKDCEEKSEDLSSISTLEVFKRIINRNGRLGKRSGSSRGMRRSASARKVDCGGGLIPRDRLFTIRFCPPEEDEFLERLDVSKAEWDELFADGKEFYLRSYVTFMDTGIKQLVAYVQNLESQLDTLETRYQNAVDEQRRSNGDASSLESLYAEVQKNKAVLKDYQGKLKLYVRSNAIACMSVTGNLQPKED
jgi:hypothetical protein